MSDPTATSAAPRAGIASLTLALLVPVLLVASFFGGSRDMVIYVMSGAAFVAAILSVVLAIVSLARGRELGGRARTVSVAAVIVAIGAIGLCGFDVFFWWVVETFKWH